MIEPTLRGLSFGKFLKGLIWNPIFSNFFDINLKLKSEKQKGVYLVDTHYTYPFPDKKFVKLLHDKSVKIIDLFILVEAEANEIAQRRINRGRKKDSVNINFIK